MKVSAILLAAGTGARLKSKVSKPLTLIAGKPLIVYSLLALERQRQVSQIIVVVNPRNRAGILSLIKRYGIKKVNAVVYGGALRQDSVKNGLAHVDRECGIVLIHDSGRPFINKSLLDRLIGKAAKVKAAVLAVPVKATIKSATKKLLVKETLKRQLLWEVQTPQVFAYPLIRRAFKYFGSSFVTDDSALVEKTGAKVHIVEGSYANIKITTPEDILIAGCIAKNRKVYGI
jgi:2-C-methyl-D-erythritol 4-phosphate cytidylyltransferase